MATFTVGQAVWFKRAGSTPFVTGDAANSALPVLNQLGGRGAAAITISESQFKIGKTMGVPEILTSDLPPVISSDDAFPKTTISGVGLKLGVREQTVVNPLAPKSVSTDGIFDASTPNALYNTGNDDSGSIMDEGAVDRDGKDTLRTIDPNYPTGRPNAAVAEGINTPVGGTQDFVPETIDNKTASKRVGVRLPSVEQQAGFVVEVLTATAKSVSPDGTVVNIGDQLAWVNWGPTNPSNPHKMKWYNKMRTTLHASNDLVAA